MWNKKRRLNEKANRTFAKQHPRAWSAEQLPEKPAFQVIFGRVVTRVWPRPDHRGRNHFVLSQSRIELSGKATKTFHYPDDWFDQVRGIERATLWIQEGAKLSS